MATNDLTFKIHADAAQAIRELRRVRRTMWSVTVLRDWPFYAGFVVGVLACAAVALAALAS